MTKKRKILASVLVAAACLTVLALVGGWVLLDELQDVDEVVATYEQHLADARGESVRRSLSPSYKWRSSTQFEVLADALGKMEVEPEDSQAVADAAIAIAARDSSSVIGGEVPQECQQQGVLDSTNDPRATRVDGRACAAVASNEAAIERVYDASFSVDRTSVASLFADHGGEQPQIINYTTLMKLTVVDAWIEGHGSGPDEGWRRLLAITRIGSDMQLHATILGGMVGNVVMSWASGAFIFDLERGCRLEDPGEMLVELDRIRDELVDVADIFVSERLVMLPMLMPAEVRDRLDFPPGVERNGAPPGVGLHEEVLLNNMLEHEVEGLSEYAGLRGAGYGKRLELHRARAEAGDKALNPLRRIATLPSSNYDTRMTLGHGELGLVSVALHALIFRKDKGRWPKQGELVRVTDPVSGQGYRWRVEGDKLVIRSAVADPQHPLHSEIVGRDERVSITVAVPDGPP